MAPRTVALLVAGLTLVSVLSGCFSDPPEEEAPPVETPPPAPPQIPHNVTAYPGTINFAARGPTPSGSIFGSSSGGPQTAITTTTNYTGLVVKMEWTASSAASTNLKLVCTPESETAEPIVLAGPSPLHIPIDMTGNAPRTWRVQVQVDDETNPAGAGGVQDFVVTVGQYAGQNNTFDPTWDPVAS